MFRSINDHRQLQVLHDEFEFQLKFTLQLTMIVDLTILVLQT